MPSFQSFHILVAPQDETISPTIKVIKKQSLASKSGLVVHEFVIEDGNRSCICFSCSSSSGSHSFLLDGRIHGLILVAFFDYCRTMMMMFLTFGRSVAYMS
jgi:hypothetical protein